MLKFLIYALQFGFGKKHESHANPHPYHSGNSKTEKKAFKRARKREAKSWWPKFRASH